MKVDPCEWMHGALDHFGPSEPQEDCEINPITLLSWNRFRNSNTMVYIWWIINKQCSFCFRMFICTFENTRKINAIDFSESGRAMFTPPNLKDMYTYAGSYRQLKHTTTLFSLSDHYILSREWWVIVDQLHTNYHGRPMVYNQSGVTELLIMRDTDYGRMCFKSVL